MFCAKCGAADQQPENYCRSCGTFLPDLSKPVKKTNDPQMQLKMNSTLSFMSAAVSLGMSIAILVVFIGRPAGHWLIYLSLALFMANFFWQISSFWNIQKLKKHLLVKPNNQGNDDEKAMNEGVIKELSMPANDNAIYPPPSVTENTTKLLEKK